MTATPSLTMSTKFGTVKVISNGGAVRVSNNPQYDRKTGEYGLGDSNGVTDLVVRNVPYIVGIWFRFDAMNYLTAEDRPNIYRADKFMSKPTAAAKEALCTELRQKVAELLKTPEGRKLLEDGQKVADDRNVAMAEAKVEECRRALAEAEAELAALRS